MTDEPEVPHWVPDWESACMRQHWGGFWVTHPDHEKAVEAAYRRGYNDHARAQQHWQDTHGAYRAAIPSNQNDIPFGLEHP